MAKYKYWRVQNVVNRSMPLTGVTASELYFVTKSGVLSNESGRISTDSEWGSSYGGSYYVVNLVDNNPSTMWATKAGDKGGNAENWAYAYVQYNFSEPQEVTHIKVQMRQDMQPSWGQEWQTANIYVSDNGINWIKYGYVEPKIAQMDLSLKTAKVIKYPSIIINIKENGASANYNVSLFDKSAMMLVRTVTPVNGVAEFNGLDASKKYFAVAFYKDDTKRARIQDRLTPT